MKIGFCAGPDRIRAVRDAGFDYMEMPVKTVTEMEDGAFEDCLALLRDTGMTVPRCNVLFPGSIKLLEDPDGMDAWLDRVFARAERLGSSMVVFGSGGSRKRPENMDYREAFLRLVEVTRKIGDAAGKHGITIVVEPLNRQETNMINSLAEGACLVAAAGHPHVELLADYYHIARDGEPVEDVVRLCGVRHVHLAALEGRRIPLEPEEGIRNFFTALKKTDYQGMVSIEGRCEDLRKEGLVSIALLREMWEKA